MLKRFKSMLVLNTVDEDGDGFFIQPENPNAIEDIFILPVNNEFSELDLHHTSRYLESIKNTESVRMGDQVLHCVRFSSVKIEVSTTSINELGDRAHVDDYVGLDEYTSHCSPYSIAFSLNHLNGILVSKEGHCGGSIFSHPIYSHLGHSLEGSLTSLTENIDIYDFESGMYEKNTSITSKLQLIEDM